MSGHERRKAAAYLLLQIVRNVKITINMEQYEQQKQHFILHRTDYSFIKYRCKIEKKEYMYRKSDSGGKIIVMCKEAN